MKNQIRNIIRESNLDPSIRELLQETFTALVGRQENLEKELRKVLGEKPEAELPSSVSSGLVPTSSLPEWEARGFFEVDPESPEDVFFLKVPYGELSGLYERKLRGKKDGQTVTYQLVPYFGCIDVEKELRLVWQLYRFSSVPPFLPWARRSVRIISDVPGLIDPDFAANGLEEKVLAGRRLVWNIERRAGEVLDTKIAPRGLSEIHKYFYSSKHRNLELYILPFDLQSGRLDPAEVDVEKENGKTCLISRKPFLNLECFKFAIHPVKENLPEFAWPGCRAKFDAHTPQSRADFNRLLANYAMPGFSCHLANGNAKPLPRFIGPHRTNKQDRLAEIISANARLEVEVQGEPLFLADYANLVLEELERTLPSWQWRAIPCGSGNQ